MIERAGKYSSVNQARKRRPEQGTRAPASNGVRVPILRKPLWADVNRAADQVAKLTQQEIRQRSGVNIIVPRPSAMTYGDWVWKGLREGEWLNRYLQFKRHTTRTRHRRVARARHGFQQNNRSDVRLLASIPAYDYFAIRKYVDKDFFQDNSNLRSYRRDNEDACVYL